MDRQLSMARLGERHGQVTTAEKIYQEVIVDHPQNVIALHRLGVMAAKDHRLDEANDLFQKALEQEPENVEILVDLGYAHFLQDDLVKAEQFLKQAVALDGQNQRARNNLGQVLAQMGNWDDSLDQFQRVADEDDAYANLAFMQAQLGEIELAEANFHRAVSIDTSNLAAGEGLLQLASAKARAERAIQSRVAQGQEKSVRQVAFNADSDVATSFDIPASAAQPLPTHLDLTTETKDAIIVETGISSDPLSMPQLGQAVRTAASRLPAEPSVVRVEAPFSVVADHSSTAADSRVTEDQHSNLSSSQNEEAIAPGLSKKILLQQTVDSTRFDKPQTLGIPPLPKSDQTLARSILSTNQSNKVIRMAAPLSLDTESVLKHPQAKSKSPTPEMKRKRPFVTPISPRSCSPEAETGNTLKKDLSEGTTSEAVRHAGETSFSVSG